MPWFRRLLPLLACLLHNLACGEQELTTLTFIGGDFSGSLGLGRPRRPGDEDVFVEAVGVWNNSAISPIPGSPYAVGRIDQLVANGTILYAAGLFRMVDKVIVNNIVRYDTLTDAWSPLCSGVNGEVFTAAYYGDTVFIGGAFTSALRCPPKSQSINVQFVAMFKPSIGIWSAIGTTGPPAAVTAMAVVSSGNGAFRLYATGTDPHTSTPFLWYWDSAGQSDSWFPAYGTFGNPGDVFYTLNPHPTDGKLYIGGRFQNGTMNAIMAYAPNASMLVSVGGGLVGGDVGVRAIAFTGDGAVIAGGMFLIEPANSTNLAIFDGSQWSGVGGGAWGVPTHNLCNVHQSYVNSIVVQNDTLLVAGRFTGVGQDGVSVNNAAAYDLQSGVWSPIGNDTLLSNALLESAVITSIGDVFVTGPLVNLYEYSEFNDNAITFSRWRGSGTLGVGGSWTDLADDPLSTFLDIGKVYAVAANGSDVFVGGRFVAAGNDASIHNLAMWDGQEWHPVGGGIGQNGRITALAVDGDSLYVGGSFNLSGSPNFVSIARYDARLGVWDPLDGGVYGDCGTKNSVFTIAITDSYVYAGGSFSSVGGSAAPVPSPNLAKWNKAALRWEPVARFGVPKTASSPAVVNALLLNDTSLYVGGLFDVSFPALNWTLQNLALLDTANDVWLPFPGVGLRSASSPSVFIASLVIDLSRNVLIIGGAFDYVTLNAQAVTVYNVAEFDGTDWSALDGGLNLGVVANAQVSTLAFDSSQNLTYAGGSFGMLNNLAMWDGQTWSSMLSKSPDWTGTVSVIVTYESPVDVVALPPSSLEDWFAQHEAAALAFIVAVALLLVAFASLLALWFDRRRRRKYVEIPTYTEPRNFLGELVKGLEINIIQPEDLTVGERISRGSSGDVYRGAWLGQDVAIKRLTVDETAISERFKQDFPFEIQLMSSLDHENVIKFLGVAVCEDNEMLLVMQYMEHGSLKDLIQRSAGKIDPKLKLRLALDVAKGMEYLHSRNPPVIHRDLKTSNVLIDRRWRCVCADFGISRIKPLVTQSMTTLVGTPAYMAPEVITSNKYSEAADVYSFGVLLGELYSGRTPYSDLDLFPQQIMYAVANQGLRPPVPDDVPQPILMLILDCYDGDPEKRPNFTEIRNRLKRIRTQ